jgi:hypothetical protein
MNLPDSSACQRLALMSPTPLVAIVLTRGVVLNEPTTVAVLAAAPKLRIERINDIGLKSPDLDLADEGANVLLGVHPIGTHGRLTPSVQGEILIQQLVDSRTGPRVTTLLHFRQQPNSRLLGPPPGTRPSRNDLDQIVPTPRDRVNPSIDADAQRTARKLVDASPLSPLPPSHPCHDSSITRFAS